MGLSQSYVRKPWVLVLLAFFNRKAAHQVTVAHPAPSAVTYHKSLILRRRNNQNADQQNWRFNHHVHRHFRSPQEPGERQEQMYDMDVMEPFQDAEQKLQREKRHQKVQKSREQEETHWLAFRFGNHLQRQGRSAGPEAWRDRKTSTNGSQTRGQFHQHSNPSGPGPEHEWGFTFTRSSPILSSLNVLSRNKRRCFTVIDFPAQRAGFNSKGSSCCFPPMVLIFHPWRRHICETIERNNLRRNLVFTVAGLKTEMTLCGSLSIIIIFVHPHCKRPFHYQNIVHYTISVFPRAQPVKFRTML